MSELHEKMSAISLLDNSNTCTPTKDGINENDVLSIITPEMKKSLFSIPVEDKEDSGLEMGFKKLQDDQPMPRYTALCLDKPSDSLTPDICFQIRKPRRKVGLRNSLLQSKRPLDDEESTPTAKFARQDNACFKRSFSFGDQPVKSESPMKKVENAVSRLSQCQDLVADGSSTYSLPTVRGQHPDLKSISHDTTYDLLKGEYDHATDSYRVIDCRYPYEFQGGHIKGAENRYTHESIMELLTSQNTPTVSSKRHILIFHCEFSSERAPKLCRFLRQKDREQNKDNYPALNYPEIYILHGGYKAFFENHTNMCSPETYKPMLHSDHSADLRHFRKKSKSWTAGEKRRYALKALRF